MELFTKKNVAVDKKYFEVLSPLQCLRLTLASSWLASRILLLLIWLEKLGLSCPAWVVAPSRTGLQKNNFVLHWSSLK